MKPKIAIDIDGVMLDSMSKLVELYNAQHKTNYRLEQLTKWEVWEPLKTTKKEVFELFDQITDKGLWPQVNPCDPYAPTVTQKLSKQYEIQLVTARTVESMNPVLDRLMGLGYVFDGAIRVAVQDTTAKAKFAKDFKFFVDDSPYQSMAIAEAGGTVLLYDQPWNRHIEDTPNLCRVRDWKDVGYVALMPEKK